jgi:hypothetical protein
MHFLLSARTREGYNYVSSPQSVSGKVFSWWRAGLSTAKAGFATAKKQSAPTTSEHVRAWREHV